MMSVCYIVLPAHIIKFFQARLLAQSTVNQIALFYPKTTRRYLRVNIADVIPHLYNFLFIT